jgi:carboxyl-terminal processing protease
MERVVQRMLTFLVSLLLGASACSQVLVADETSPTPNCPPDLARRIGEITDAVLEHHIDPPARQQMVLGGVKALYQATRSPVPAGLSRRVSALTAPKQIATFLTDIWPKSTVKPITATALEEAMIQGLLADISEGASLISAKERAVMEQFEGNRYVGIHIALGLNDQEKRPSIFDVIDGGPADRAGVKKGDLLEMIDGADTKGMPLREAVDRLRGDEGTNVTIKVRQPKAANSRTYTVTRGQHARSTVLGVRKRPAGDWDCMLDASAPIAYLRIDQIAMSTPHDLRKLARRLESQGHCGIILDLRSVGGTSVHPAVLLADDLLPGGVIGRVQSAGREVTYQADPDALFRGLPIAALVNQFTSGTAEWIVAALQDNHRAMIVGSPTFSATVVTQGGISRRSDVRSTVSVGDGSWSMELMTGYLERGDGRRLSSDVTGTRATGAVTPRRDWVTREVATGVKPDHAVGMAETRTERFVPSEPPRTPDQKSSLANDPVLQEALRLLRHSLQKFI